MVADATYGMLTSEVQVECARPHVNVHVQISSGKCNHFRNLLEAIISLKATTTCNASWIIDPSNWLALLITDWGHSYTIMAKHNITHTVHQN